MNLMSLKQVSVRTVASLVLIVALAASIGLLSRREEEIRRLQQEVVIARTLLTEEERKVLQRDKALNEQNQAIQDLVKEAGRIAERSAKALEEAKKEAKRKASLSSNLLIRRPLSGDDYQSSVDLMNEAVAVLHGDTP